MINPFFHIKIPKRSSHCFFKGEFLQPGMEITSLILENEKEIIRQDFCIDCWNILQTNRKEKEMQNYWKWRIEQKKNILPSTKVSKAFELLFELQQAAEPQHEEIFVLCLFLTRVRQLVFRQEFKKEGISYHLYEIIHKEEFLTIKAIDPSQLQINAIQKTLAQKLQPQTTKVNNVA